MLFGVLQGIVIAVILSTLHFFQRPHGDVLGRDEPDQIWQGVELHPDATETDGIMVYRWDAPLFFANSGLFMKEIRTLVRQRHPRWVILQCEAVTDIDVAAADMLERRDVELNAQEIHLAFVKLRERLHDLVVRYGLHHTLDRDHSYPSIQTALTDIARLDTDPQTLPTNLTSGSRFTSVSASGSRPRAPSRPAARPERHAGLRR